MDRVIIGRMVATAILLLLTIVTANAQGHGSANQDPMSMLPLEHLVLPIGPTGQEMEVVVYTPHTYDPSKTYPLLVVADADPLLGILKTLNFLWGEEQRVESVILVGLPFGNRPEKIWANRSYYLLPDSVGVIDYYDMQIPLHNGGGAPELAVFLHDQVLPSVMKRYSVDRDRVGLAGFSMGGLFSAWHFVTHPGHFSDYIIISPPLAAPFVDAEFETATESRRNRSFERATRVYVSYAENDLAQVRSGAPPWAKAFGVLEDPNFHFRSERIDGLYHDSSAIPALINAYDFLYAR